MPNIGGSITAVGDMPAMTHRGLLAALLVAALWGFNFSVIKLGVAELDPFVLAALRFALCAVPLVFALPKPPVAWRWLVAYGLAFGVGTWGLLMCAMRLGLTPALAAWLLQASAFLTPLLAWAWLREPMRSAQRLGAAVALLGFGLVLFATAGHMPVTGLLLAPMAAGSLSVANVVVRRSGVQAMLAFMVWSCLFAPLPLLALALMQGGFEVLQTLPAQLARPVALGSLAVQVYPVTLLGYWVWNRLRARYGGATVVPVALLVPVFALVFGDWVFGRWPSAGEWAGMAVIGLGLVISLRPARSSAPASRQRRA